MAVKKEKKLKWSETEIGKWVIRWGFWAVIMPIFLPWFGQLFDWNGWTLSKIYCWMFAFIAVAISHASIAKLFKKEQDEEDSKAEKEEREPKDVKDEYWWIYLGSYLVVFFASLFISLGVAAASFNMRYVEVEYTLHHMKVDGELVELDEPIETTIIMKRSEVRESLAKVCPECAVCPSAEETPPEAAPSEKTVAEDKPSTATEEEKTACTDCPGTGIRMEE